MKEKLAPLPFCSLFIPMEFFHGYKNAAPSELEYLF